MTNTILGGVDITLYAFVHDSASMRQGSGDITVPKWNNTTVDYCCPWIWAMFSRNWPLKGGREGGREGGRVGGIPIIHCVYKHGQNSNHIQEISRSFHMPFHFSARPPLPSIVVWKYALLSAMKPDCVGYVLTHFLELQRMHLSYIP